MSDPVVAADLRIFGAILVRGSGSPLKEFLKDTEAAALARGLEVLHVRSSATRLRLAGRGGRSGVRTAPLPEGEP